jgi:hypothetical protein
MTGRESEIGNRKSKRRSVGSILDSRLPISGLLKEEIA